MEAQNLTNDEKIELILKEILNSLDVQTTAKTHLDKLDFILKTLKEYPSVRSISEHDVLDYFNAEDIIYWMPTYSKESCLHDFLSDININSVKEHYGQDKFYDYDTINDSLKKCAECIGKYYTKEEMIKNISEYVEKNWYKMR